MLIPDGSLIPFESFLTNKVTLLMEDIVFDLLSANFGYGMIKTTGLVTLLQYSGHQMLTYKNIVRLYDVE